MISRGFLTRIMCCVVGASSGGAPAVAHHSRAPYDTTVEVNLEGTVAKVLWENPHTYLTLRLAGPDGQAVMQEVEVGPLSTLRPLGLTERVLLVGEHVSVRANPNRLGAGHTAVGLDVTTSDGTIYPLHVFGRARPPPVTTKASSLAGQWVPTTEGLGGLVQGVRNWPLTEVGLKGVADVTSQLASQAECIPWPAPLLMALPVMRTIEIGHAVVSIRFDWMNAARTVHLDVAKHPADVAPSLQGHSIGRWEGDALVVDTVGFAPHREGDGWSLPSGATKHLIERFVLNDDRLSLTYQFTIEDPRSLTQPLTQSMRWAHRPDLQASGQECNAEIATRFLRQ